MLIRQVLIIDPDPRTAQVLLEILARRGARGTVAATDTHVRDLLSRSSWNLIFLALELDRFTESAATLLARIRSEHPERPVVMLSHTDSARSAIAAMRGGCTEFLVKPLHSNTVEAILDTHLPRCDLSVLSCGDTAGAGRWAIVGVGDALRRTVELARKVAPSSLPVLIHGESGTGKELLARWIHSESRRAANPFIRINCAALNDTLLESELFGHEKGAFTGALKQKPGRFEAADGGTIFLDEVADMSPSLQAKLLRVTQEGRFNRIGSNHEIQTNARILAATNRLLEEEVKAGRFREDLFYRLNVVELNIPPLRERQEDILPLASAFIAEFTQGRARFSSAVVDCLTRYAWPGNVRQLRNAMERAALLSRGELILPEHLPAQVRPGPESVPATQPADQHRLGEIERQAIFQALRKHDFNRTETAKALGISRRALLYKLQRFRELGYEVDPDGAR
jgi:DNA-binding NtrC family response regulator